jgi:hypothetical protein
MSGATSTKRGSLLFARAAVAALPDNRWPKDKVAIPKLRPTICTRSFNISWRPCLALWVAVLKRREELKGHEPAFSPLQRAAACSTYAAPSQVVLPLARFVATFGRARHRSAARGFVNVRRRVLRQKRWRHPDPL